MFGEEGVNLRQLGPDLPIRGLYETGYIVGWEPAFFRLLLPGSGRGSSSRSFLASAGTEAQWDDISVDWGGANLIWLGWTKNPGGTSTWYGRLAIITHDWRAVDNEDLWAHTKGFTLPGAFQSGAMQSKFSITEALGTVMGDVLPFNCYVYPDLVGQPSETEKMRDTQK